MSKKILNLISFLFLLTVLAISCSNADKTGSADNNIGNGGSSTGGSGSGTGDGGTTTQGIEKYAGTWTATFNGGLNTYNIIIGNNGTVTIKDISETKAENIQGSGNKYTMTIQHFSGGEPLTITITFDNETSGDIYDEDFGDGTITKNN